MGKKEQCKKCVEDYMKLLQKLEESEKKLEQAENTIKAMDEAADIQADSYKRQIAALQKQADESDKDYIELDLECRELHTKLEQAVKDTAKEIYEIAVDFYDGKNIDGAWFFGALKERYGVEVE